MSIREGLGYNLMYYDPCFSMNSNRFCCSKRGNHFRNNVLLSNCPMSVGKSDSYLAPRNYDPSDTRSLNVKEVGLWDPKPYTFTPQEEWNIWCSRMPCSLNQKGIPCQKYQPYCKSKKDCRSCR